MKLHVAYILYKENIKNVWGKHWMEACKVEVFGQMTVYEFHSVNYLAK